MSKSSALNAAQKRLGVMLPKSYRTAWERHSFAALDEPRLFLPDELCWLEEHPVGKNLRPNMRGVVIGEDIGGNPLLLRCRGRGEGAYLDDAVYCLNHDGAEIEDVADDIEELLGVQQTSGPVATIVETAVIAPVDADTFMEALDAVLQRRGFGEPPAANDAREGDHLRAHLYAGTAEECLLWIHGAGASQLDVVRSLARTLRVPLEAHESVVRDQRLADHDDNFWARVRSVSVDAAATMQDVEPAVPVDEGASHGDAWETAATLTNELLFGHDALLDTPIRKLRYFRALQNDPLPARLRGLVVAIEEASAVTMTEIGGQKAIRIELPDGSRQISALSDDELDLLGQHVGLPE